MLLFIDESGSVATDDVFAVGLLIVKNSQWLKEVIRNVRESNAFDREFHLSKIHKGSYQAYVDLIKSFSEHFSKPRARRHIRFRTVCVLGKTGIRHQKEHIAYNYYVEWTLRHNLNKDMKGSVLYVDQKSRYDEDALLTRLQVSADVNKPGTIKKVEELDSAKSDFLQVCDVLTGVVRHGNLIEHGLIKKNKLSSSRGKMKTELWKLIKPYYGKSQPFSCHQIKGGTYEAIQEKYNR